MGTKLNTAPHTDKELNELFSQNYLIAKSCYENGKQCNFTGLLEIIESEPNIISAMHKIKSNNGSQTPGVDGKIMDNYLEMGYEEIIDEVQKRLRNYKPEMVSRTWIPKPGKKEMRPLGIPTIIDRIVQECVRRVLEPIAEGQFFNHSYGFRPMRSPSMAIERIKSINWIAKCYWVVEGDIKGFFDNINHNVMIESLWDIGIRDKRVLSIIKQMLKAGVMNECTTSEIGTPQGGIISPLLANIYLNRFDNYITREFERKKLRKSYSRRDQEIASMRKHSNLKTSYYVRFADDWVILTDSKESAEKLKAKAKRYLKDNLKLELSEEKTLITNVCSKPIKFLGLEMMIFNKNGRLVNRVMPNKERLDAKMKLLRKELFALRKINSADRKRIVQNIIRVNSIILGILNYYSVCDQISVSMRKYAWKLKYTAYKSLKRFVGKWIRACDVSNLIGFHKGHKAHIPAIEYDGMWIGITDLNFAKWVKTSAKNQNETPYTAEGRELYNKRMRKKGLNARTDEVNSSAHALFIRMSKNPLYNFEYFMNRPYAYNRDKGKCKICGGYVEPNEAHFHHVNNKLPLNQVNKVKNLITCHAYCHKLIHSNTELPELSGKTTKRIAKYRKLLAQNA